jgi:antitoxin component YwqK of YwqJK toxin-antitoxin module
MIQIHLVLLLCFLFTASCAPRKDYNMNPTLAHINIIDQNGTSEVISNPERLKMYDNVNFLSNQPYNQVLRVYHRNTNGDIRACATSYYPNGQVKQSLEILNGRAFGPYQEWHENGRMKVDTFIVGGDPTLDQYAPSSWLFDGPSRAWDEEGNVSGEFTYSKGALDGDVVYYHKNGRIWKKAPFKGGLVDGTEQIFLDDGTLFQETTYSQNKKEGQSVRYWNVDQIASQETYIQDRLIEGKYYDLKGCPVSEVTKGCGNRALFSKTALSELHEYRNGIEEGLVQVFSASGLLLSSHEVQNQLKHGDEIIYYTTPVITGNPQPKVLITWTRGMIQGIVKTWYPNGIIESQREMSNNQKNGILTTWYEDGNLMMIESYEKDKLVRGEYFQTGSRIPISEVIAGNGTVTLYDSIGKYLRKVSYYNGRPIE